MEWEEFLGKCVTYNQIRLLNYPPLAFKEFPSCEKIYFIACLSSTEISFLFWCATVDRSDPYRKPNRLRHASVSCRFTYVMVWYSLSGKLVSTPGLQNGLPFPHLTLFQKTWGKSFTLRTQTRISVKPVIYLLVANAMSVCNLVSTLLLSWVYQGSCFWFNYVLFLSQRWWWWWWWVGGLGGEY